MKNTVQHILTLLLLLLICSGVICLGGDLTVTGSWTEMIDSLDLQAGAGSDLIDTYESASNTVAIDIIAPTNWRVDVKKSDTNWHANFQLYVRRTSDGSGSGSISGGTSYQEITDTDQSFFNGTLDRSNITGQLKLTGVSVQIPVDTYTTTVYYTVVEI